MQILIGYKVLDRELKSASTPKGSGEIQYKLNKWTYHKKNHGPLAIFKKKKDAIKFKKQETIYYGLCPASCLVIYKCIYIQSTGKTLWTTSTELCEKTFHNLFPDTDLAEAIMLIQKCHC